MGRPVRVFEPLWFDHQFKKDLKRLSKPQQAQRLQEIKALSLALAESGHPTHDPGLAGWKPSAYHVPKVPADVRLYEYRCAYPLRVIACWVEPCEGEPEGAVLLVAATLSHDHQRLKEIIGSHRAGLKEWP
ncbi:MAG TPA: hypothetical protein VFC23_15920 [Thermoanaerobaculia bacterium]|nr:hypothetical protein [Thermoanaerobaculia bacterium]